MKDFRGPLPLTDDDFAQIRRNVLAAVGKRKTRPIWIAFPIAAAIALAFVLWPAREPQRIAVAPAPAVRPSAPITQHAAPPVLRVARARTPSRSRAARRRHEPMRIEFQTADPNVRIIWIVK